jgi:phosphate starvation-inducible PhoH-like protein
MLKLDFDEPNAEQLFGTRDENLKYLEDRLGVGVNARGGELVVSGGDERAERIAVRLLEAFDRLISNGAGVGREEFRTGVRVLEEDADIDLVEFFLDASIPPTLKRFLAPRNLNQRLFIRSVGSHDYVFAIGPAGTGKTYLAVAMAAAELLDKKVKRLVLCRPAVEAGERLGFLPGDLVEKVNPYLRPVYDALYDILGYDKTTKLLERQVIEIAPLAFMRGRTLSNAFVVLDEAQNATTMQMKMFLTRLGEGSRMVITGDRSQVDLPRGVASGLADAERLLGKIDSISFNYFTSKDVVRHPLVAKIIEAYDADGA